MESGLSMAEKKVLVTGSGTGIGRGVALGFAEAGADVVLHYAHSAEGALTAAEKARELGVRATALQADFSRVEEARRLGREAVEFLEGIDVLVNNAGITMNRPFAEVSAEQFDTLYNVNVRAQFFLTQEVLPTMLSAGRGSIVNITSIHAFQGFPEHAVYAGTKGAIMAYTRELAVELAPRNIRVNAIAPGAIAVESHRSAIVDHDPDAWGQVIPAGFAGGPQDVAELAVFLASDRARYIVGQTLIIDGGTTAWMPFSDAFRHPIRASFGKGYVPGL